LKKLLLYGAKIWTCTKREESKPQGTVIKFRRAVVEKTRRHRIRNPYIKGRAQDGGSTEPN
jgi:hypothetical protein